MKQAPSHCFFRHYLLKAGPVALLFFVVLAQPAMGAGSVDAGRAAFPLCLSCHSDPPTAARFDPYRFNAAALTSAFQGILQMSGNLALGSRTINDIASYLGLPNANDTDRLLDWAEELVPELLTPSKQPTGQLLSYTYRFYPATGVYLASKDGNIWFFDSRTPGAAVVNVGTVRALLDLMPNGR
jgi:hypothetical protein